MEIPSVRRQISRIISSYSTSKFFHRFQDGVVLRQSQNSRSETTLQVAEWQMDIAVAGYYSRAHPEIASFIGEDWGADHTNNLRRTSTACGQTITDPGSFYLEVIAPELIQLWIMEDLRVDEGVASQIQRCPHATNYGRLVLETDVVDQQVPHQTNAHSAEQGGPDVATGRQRRRRQHPKRS